MRAEARQILDELVERCQPLGDCADDILAAAEAICQCYAHDGRVYVCGNGGSAADADHMVGEFMNRYNRKRTIPANHAQQLVDTAGADAPFLIEHLQQAVPAVSLASHGSLITSIANDVNADMIFAQQVYGYCRRGDILIALSTSGASINVIYALKTAHALGTTTIGLTGSVGGIISTLCDILVTVPEKTTSMIQEQHTLAYHAICGMVEAELFAD